MPFEGPECRFDEQVISFSDPDGLLLELVATSDNREAWKDGPVPPRYVSRGFYRVTLSEHSHERTAKLLANTLGFGKVRKEGNLVRCEVGDGGPGTFVDVLSSPDAPEGIVSVGTVHHVAWRISGDEEQRAWRERIAEIGVNVTPVIGRKYFRSIYFKEPRGVLFEVATDRPTFAVDEPPKQLGTTLLFPPWLEPMRGEIERALPPVRLPNIAQVK